MTNNCVQLTQDTDWGMVILEVQTAPDMAESSQEYTMLYEAIYGVLITNARKWLISRGYSHAHDQELMSIGLDFVFKVIDKFEVPEKSSEEILRSFKAWALKCSVREWTKRVQLEKCFSQDNTELTFNNQTPSVEDVLIDEEEKSTPQNRSNADIELQRKILCEELDQLPSEMRDALLEIEDLKRPDSPNGRGKQGESKLIAEKYGHTTGSIRTRRSRLASKVKDRFKKESQT